MRRLRSFLSAPTTPPEGILGDRALEARWWWIQSQAVADDARAFMVYEWGLVWIEGYARAIELARRAVLTCPADDPDRVKMASCAAELVLDLCDLAPAAVGPHVTPLLSSVREYCDLLSPAEAAPLRVRALPLAMALGGSAAQALIELDSARALLAGRPMENGVAQAVQSLAHFLAALGDSERSLALFELVETGLARELEVQESIDLPATVAEGLGAVRRGSVPTQIDFEAMTPRELTHTGEALGRVRPTQTQQLTLVLDRASSLLMLGRPVEASEMYTALLDLPELKSPARQAQLLLFRAAARLDAEDGEAAAADFASATTRTADEDADPPVFDPGLIAFVRARVAATGGAEAEAEFEAATRLNDGTPLGWRVWAARAEHERPRPAVALQSYRRMTLEIARERRSSLGYRLDSTSLRNKLPALTDAVHLSSDCGDWRAALELIETFKARQLQAVLADRTGGLGPASTALEEIDRRIDALEYALPEVDPRAKATELVRLRSERVVLIERSEWHAGAIAMAGLLAPVDDLVEALSEPGLAVVDIHLHLASRRLIAVGLREGRGTVGEVELSQQTLDGITQREANLRRSSPDSLLYDPIRSPALSVEQLLPPSVIEMLDGAESLVISPHGALHLVSWPAMELSGRRLLADRAVSVTPSLWVQAQLPPVQASSSGIVCLGAPAGESMPALGEIPDAAVELKVIEDLYRAADRDVTSLTGTAATTTTFTSLEQGVEPRPFVLHLACHATTGSDGFVGFRPFLDGPDDPLAASLVLADGAVDADQIRRLRLPFAEVVLSACSTGWRPTRVADVELSADSALGLVASFLAAGASTVVASLPQVEDAVAPELFRRYHELRLSGRPPASALCAAQAQLLDAGEIEAPHVVGFLAFGR